MRRYAAGAAVSATTTTTEELPESLSEVRPQKLSSLYVWEPTPPPVDLQTLFPHCSSIFSRGGGGWGGVGVGV